MEQLNSNKLMKRILQLDTDEIMLIVDPKTKKEIKIKRIE